MHRRPLLRRSWIALAAGALAVLSACSSAVQVTPFAGSQSPVCRAVAAAWPLTVGREQPRVTAVQDVTVAAWGDPPIIARCGAPVPGPTTNPCQVVDGVDWISEELDDGVRFTTYGRDPAIEVLVPDAYSPEPLVLPAFAGAATTVPQTGTPCS